MIDSVFYVIANTAAAAVGMWVCACRMGLMSARHTKMAIRVQYAVLFSAFSASGISWTYHDPASITQLCMTLAMVGHLILGADAWRYGAPTYTYRTAGAD